MTSIVSRRILQKGHVLSLRAGGAPGGIGQGVCRGVWRGVAGVWRGISQGVRLPVSPYPVSPYPVSPYPVIQYWAQREKSRGRRPAWNQVISE
jgi:hypothetical protein